MSDSSVHIITLPVPRLVFSCLLVKSMNRLLPCTCLEILLHSQWGCISTDPSWLENTKNGITFTIRDLNATPSSTALWGTTRAYRVQILLLVVLGMTGGHITSPRKDANSESKVQFLPNAVTLVLSYSLKIVR